MIKVTNHYIFPDESYSTYMDHFVEDAGGHKFYRGRSSIIINEVFTTEKGIYFNGMFIQDIRGNSTGTPLMFCPLDIDKFKETKGMELGISEKFMNKIVILFNEVSEKV